MHEYGIPLQQQPLTGYDAIILAVSHNEYLNLSNDYLHSLCQSPAVFIDIKGSYRLNKPDGMMYWSL